jgi:periplasmic protein TonB
VTHALAFALTAGIGAILLMPQRSSLPKTSAAQVIQIALEPDPPLPAPAPPAPEQSAPDPPKVSRPVLRHDVRKPDPAPIMADEVASPVAMEAPLDQSSVAAVEAPSPKSTPPGDIESQYAATLRSNIDSRTSVPATAEYRLLKPHGEVRVHFTLDRSGMLIASELARSSGSALLDRHALEIVRTGHYPPFPGDAFQGASHHTFLITLEFHS